MFLKNARGAPLESVLPAATWPFSLDWSSPEANGLVELFMQTPAGMMNLVSGEIGVRSGSADPGIIFPSGGMASYFDGDGDQYSFSDVSGIDSTLPFTLVWEAWPFDVIDPHPSVANFKSVGSNALRLSYSSTVGDLFLSETTTTMCRFVFSPWASQYNEHHRGVVTYDGSAYLLYINGGKAASSGSASVALVTNATRIGGTSNATHDWAGAIRQVRRYTRAWSDEEAYAYCNRTGDALVRTEARVRWAISGEVSLAASGSGLASGTVGISVAYGLVAAGVSVAGGTANLTASVPLSAAGASISSGSAGATALVSISAAGLAEAAGQAGLSSDIFLAAAGAAQASGNAALAGTLQLLAAGAAESSGNAGLLVTLSFSASGGAVASGSADLQSVNAISADGFVEAMGSGTLAIHVDLSALGSANASGNAQLLIRDTRVYPHRVVTLRIQRNSPMFARIL